MDYWNAMPIFIRCYRLSSNPYTYLLLPYCTYGVSWDRRFVSVCRLESVCIHSCSLWSEWAWMVVVERTRDWNKKKKKKECDYRMFTTSSRCKNVDDNWRIFIELLFGFLFSFWSFLGRNNCFIGRNEKVKRIRWNYVFCY